MKSNVLKTKNNSRITVFFFATCLFGFLLQRCKMPSEDIELKQIKDVVADASSDPKLKAVAVLYNPNDMRAKLKHVDVEIYVNGKKAGIVNQDFKIAIPAKGEFSVPIEVELNMKELGLLNTILGVIGGKKFDIHYKGRLRVSYRGVPIRIPVDYKSEVRVSF